MESSRFLGPAGILTDAFAVEGNQAACSCRVANAVFVTLAPTIKDHVETLEGRMF